MALHTRARFEQWLPAAFDGQFEWEFLSPAFHGTKIQPMDFDGVIERNGQVLIFETKTPGQAIPRGQQITLTNEWRRGSSILHLEGKTPKTISKMAAYWGWRRRADEEFGSQGMRKAGYMDVLFATRKWFCKASDYHVPTREEWDRELWLLDYNGKLDLDAAQPSA